MTLAQIMELALRQLDEDISDIAEFDTLFRHYANEGYVTAQRRYYHPHDTVILHTDENGCAFIDGMGIVRILELHNDAGFKVPYEVSPDGRKIRARLKEEELYASCEVSYPALRTPTDEPMLPEEAHGALVDYICYRHLCNGNSAKQSRAQLYLMQYERAMRELGSQSAPSVTQMRGLYEASSIHAKGRW